MTTKKQNRGKQFEKLIKDSVKDTTFCYRLRDSSGAWGEGDKTRFTPSNICDYILYFEGDLILLEAKTTKGKSLPFSNIKQSQINGFKGIEGQYEGVMGIFAVEFSEIKETYFIEAGLVIDYIESTTTRKSIPLEFIKAKGERAGIQKGKKVKLEIEEGIKKIK